VEWIFNNGILTPASSLLANIVNKRPKITSFGNSINAQNVLGNFWALNGMVNWLHALTNAGFDRCRTIPYNWGDKFTAGSSQQGALDA